MPQGRTPPIVRDHLSSIYRRFIRRGDLKLTLNGEALEFEDPEILDAPYWKRKSEQPRERRKESAFTCPWRMQGQRLRCDTGPGLDFSAGLSLFRHDRLEIRKTARTRPTGRRRYSARLTRLPISAYLVSST